MALLNRPAGRTQKDGEKMAKKSLIQSSAFR
jgi:hypothetical protein